MPALAYRGTPGRRRPRDNGEGGASRNRAERRRRAYCTTATRRDGYTTCGVGRRAGGHRLYRGAREGQRPARAGLRGGRARYCYTRRRAVRTRHLASPFCHARHQQCARGHAPIHVHFRCENLATAAAAARESAACRTRATTSRTHVWKLAIIRCGPMCEGDSAGFGTHARRLTTATGGMVATERPTRRRCRVNLVSTKITLLSETRQQMECMRSSCTVAPGPAHTARTTRECFSLSEVC